MTVFRGKHRVVVRRALCSDDDLDDRILLEMDARWANKSSQHVYHLV